MTLLCLPSWVGRPSMSRLEKEHLMALSSRLLFLFLEQHLVLCEYEKALGDGCRHEREP